MGLSSVKLLAAELIFRPKHAMFVPRGERVGASFGGVRAQDACGDAAEIGVPAAAALS